MAITSRERAYTGERTPDGTVVRVNGEPLPLRTDRVDLARSFEWGYGGSGPSQLALAILADHFEDTEKALTLYEPFMWAVVSGLEQSHWRLDTRLIESYLREIRSALHLREDW